MDQSNQQSSIMKKDIESNVEKPKTNVLEQDKCDVQNPLYDMIHTDIKNEKVEFHLINLEYLNVYYEYNKKRFLIYIDNIFFFFNIYTSFTHSELQRVMSCKNVSVFLCLFL